MSRRVVLVTGANSGIGLATCERLTQNGWRVIGSVRSAAKALAVAAAGAETVTMETDNPESIVAAFAEIDRMTGGLGLDAVVNNAGYTQFGAVEDVAWDAAAAQLATNVIGPMEIAKAALPAMRARGEGRIVNISSIGGRVAIFPFNGWYHASKFALEAVTEVLRMEVAGAGIDVVLVEPGTVRTGFIDEMTNRAEPFLGRGSAYEKQYRRFLRLSKPYERVAMRAERVARTVERALTDDPPLPRYVVGADAWSMRITDAVLPTRARHWVTRLATGLGSRP